MSSCKRRKIEGRKMAGGDGVSEEKESVLFL